MLQPVLKKGAEIRHVIGPGEHIKVIGPRSAQPFRKARTPRRTRASERFRARRSLASRMQRWPDSLSRTWASPPLVGDTDSRGSCIVTAIKS